MVTVKTQRTPRLVKVGVWERTHRVLGWRVLWDGQVIGLITRPLPDTWEWNGRRFSSRQAAVDAVMAAHQQPVTAHGYGFQLP